MKIKYTVVLTNDTGSGGGFGLSVCVPWPKYEKI
jgi:hypothetical protein